MLSDEAEKGGYYDSVVGGRKRRWDGVGLSRKLGVVVNCLRKKARKIGRLGLFKGCAQS
jgi:hypothetical protein